MSSNRIPAGLHDRLGDAGALALVELLDTAREIGRDEVLTIAADRFECRLLQECAGLRNDIAAVRQDLTAGLAAVRQEMAVMRSEMTTSFHVELASARADVIKWSFVFWVGQVVALTGLTALLLRSTGH